MTRLAELEEMVRDAWVRGTQVAFAADPEFSRDDLSALLGVYADELQQQGDPRGELIALDLLPATTVDKARFAALAASWLGPLAEHPNVRIRFGLLAVSVSDTEPHLLQEVLASPAGRYLASVSIFGNVFTVRGALSRLADGARPWLGALRVIVPSTPVGTSFAMPVISQDLVAQLVEAAPALYMLSIAGTCVLRDFAHPKLRALSVQGHEALGALTGVGEPLAGVTDLEFMFQVAGYRADPTPETVARLLPAGHLPALRRLDVARNEPGYQPHAYLGGSVPFYPFFRRLSVLRQLTHAWLPSVRSQQDRDLLQAALDDMPELRHLQVAKLYGRGYHGLRHPSATLVIPPPIPWMPRDQLAEPMIVLSIGESAMFVDLRELITTMERVYERLPIDARVTWDDWWDVVAANGTFPASSLATALDACRDALDPGWQTVMTTLRELPDELVDAEVRIARL